MNDAVSEDVSRYYGSGSSSLLGGQLQTELVDRLEVQQLTSTTARYQQQVGTVGTTNYSIGAVGVEIGMGITYILTIRRHTQKVCFPVAILCKSSENYGLVLRLGKVSIRNSPNTRYYPRESICEGLCNHRRTFVCLSVCLSVCLLPR